MREEKKRNPVVRMMVRFIFPPGLPGIRPRSNEPSLLRPESPVNSFYGPLAVCFGDSSEGDLGFQKTLPVRGFEPVPEERPEIRLDSRIGVGHELLGGGAGRPGRRSGR